jgi:NusA-like KH domain protein
MEITFDMKFMRYMNLFNRITKLHAKHCFSYNKTIFFVVPYSLISRAIGKDNINLRELSGVIGSKIRIIAEPRGIQDLNFFVSSMIQPAKFDEIKIENNEAILNVTGIENKALIIGRNKARILELKDLLNQYFKIKNIRVV